MTQELEALLKRHEGTVESNSTTFGAYYKKVLKNPELAQLSHARMWSMLTDKSNDPNDFFSDTIFGAKPSIDAFGAVMKSAAQRMEIRKRIILFMGPPGAGKSTLVAALKRGLTEYTRRNPVYAIDGCPIHEEPLHLLPQGARVELQQEAGIYIEGDLCPYCQKVVREEYPDISKVPVRALTLSEQARVGIGTFAASDSKNQSVDDLVGAENLALLTKYGEGDPRAWSYTGEIQVGNRGMLECIELFKAHQELLWTFLDVTQEQQVKIARQAMCPVDLVIIAHTNQAEFDKFQADPKNEALRDRIVPIRVPYTLAVDDERRIYERLLNQGALRDVHVPDASLRVASQFAVISRLTESDRLQSSDENKSGLLVKMKLYNGEKQTGFTSTDVKALHEESNDEGMRGIGPRQVINALSLGVVDEGSSCLTPIRTLRYLSDYLKSNIQLKDAERDFFQSRLTIIVELFKEEIKIDVQKGFIHGFGDAAADMFERYLDNAQAYLNDEKIEDPITGRDVDPNERLMRRIEEMIGVGENQAKAFRTEINNKIAAAQRAGRKFDYASHPRLKEGIEKALFSDLKDAIAVTTRRRQDPESQKRFNEVVQQMTEMGWCTECAGECIRFVAEQLS